MDLDNLSGFSKRIRRELHHNLMPFWARHVRSPDGRRFVGRLNNQLSVQESAPKGLVLFSRLLWTFSSLHQYEKNTRWADLADEIYRFLAGRFVDREYGGCYWKLDASDCPENTLKKTYGQAFYIYGLAEYAAMTGDAKVRQEAIDMFELLEEKAYDNQEGGYFEVFEQDWSLSANQQLSSHDLDACKSMNCHLHVLEAYTRLLSIWRDSFLVSRLCELLDRFQNSIVNSANSHFHEFFDRRWQPVSDGVSFGHDIEGSWLLVEAAEWIKDTSLCDTVGRLSLQLAEAVFRDGLDADGSLWYQADANGQRSGGKHFWCQAEGVVGFINACQLSGRDSYLGAAQRLWDFIEQTLADRQYGEWYWRITEDGRPDLALPKVSEWKGPYHNVRCCLESLRRLALLGATDESAPALYA